MERASRGAAHRGSKELAAAEQRELAALWALARWTEPPRDPRTLDWMAERTRLGAVRTCELLVRLAGEVHAAGEPSELAALVAGVPLRAFEARERLVERAVALLRECRKLRARLGPDFEEAVQAVLLHMLQALLRSSLRRLTDRGLRTWLWGRLMSHIREEGKRKRELPLHELPAEDWRAEATPILEKLSQADALRKVWERVRVLDPELEDVLVAHYRDGMEWSVLARHLRCTPEALRVRVHRLLRKLGSGRDSRSDDEGGT